MATPLISPARVFEHEVDLGDLLAVGVKDVHLLDLVDGGVQLRHHLGVVLGLLEGACSYVTGGGSRRSGSFLVGTGVGAGAAGVGSVAAGACGAGVVLGAIWSLCMLGAFSVVDGAAGGSWANAEPAITASRANKTDSSGHLDSSLGLRIIRPQP